MILFKKKDSGFIVEEINADLIRQGETKPLEHPHVENDPESVQGHIDAVKKKVEEEEDGVAEVAKPTVGKDHVVFAESTKFKTRKELSEFLARLREQGIRRRISTLREDAEGYRFEVKYERPLTESEEVHRDLKEINYEGYNIRELDDGQWIIEEWLEVYGTKGEAMKAIDDFLNKYHAYARSKYGSTYEAVEDAPAGDAQEAPKVVLELEDEELADIIADPVKAYKTLDAVLDPTCHALLDSIFGALMKCQDECGGVEAGAEVIEPAPVDESKPIKEAKNDLIAELNSSSFGRKSEDDKALVLYLIGKITWDEYVARCKNDGWAPMERDYVDSFKPRASELKVADISLEDDEEGEIDFDYDEIKVGDYVDFGSYGKLYVCKIKGDDFWVTDEESDRGNPEASGWNIRKNRAKRIIDRYEEDDDCVDGLCDSLPVSQTRNENWDFSDEDAEAERLIRSGQVTEAIEPNGMWDFGSED